MTRNILVTGAAGYIGGSVLATLASAKHEELAKKNLFAAVRSKDQLEAISKVGVNVVLLDLNDKSGVTKAILDNKIDLVIHTATSSIASQAEYLITGLGELKKATGQDVLFIHSSITNLFTPEAGWPYGPVADTEDFYEREKELDKAQPGNPVRATNLTVPEVSEKLGVRYLDVVVSNIYGLGTGEWRKLCVNIPGFIRTCLKNRLVRKFDKNPTYFWTHISDLVNVYLLLVEKVLDGADIPIGRRGKYFAAAQKVPSWDIYDRLAEKMYARGLVDQPDAKIWSDYQTAADQMGLPAAYIEPMAVATIEFVPVNASKIGWKPQWNEAKLLESLDQEIQDVLDYDTIKPSLFDTF